MKLNWNFLGGGGGDEGCKTKNLPWGEYGYFLELHNQKGIGLTAVGRTRIFFFFNSACVTLTENIKHCSRIISFNSFLPVNKGISTLLLVHFSIQPKDLTLNCILTFYFSLLKQTRRSQGVLNQLSSSLKTMNLNIKKKSNRFVKKYILLL